MKNVKVKGFGKGDGPLGNLEPGCLEEKFNRTINPGEKFG
jgi:hypothetical protein